MSSSEEKAVQTEQKEDEMSAQLLENKKPQCQNSTYSFESPLDTKLAKLSMSLKNYCSIHLKLLHNLDGDSLHGLFTLHPECQIKILEENLNFLNKKNARSNNLQMKSNLCSIKPIAKPTCAVEKKQETVTSTHLLKRDMDLLSETKIKNDNENPRTEKHKNITNDADTADHSSDECFHVLPKNGFSTKYPFSSFAMLKVKDTKNTSSKKKTGSATLFSKANSIAVTPKSLVTQNLCSDSTKKKNDSDNQFEFTVEQEKIVSFVCSPSPPRKHRTSGNSSCPISDSDEENEKQSELSSSKGDSLSETVSNFSYKSNSSNNMLPKDKYPTWDQSQITNKLLWHPPSSQKYLDHPLLHKQTVFRCSSGKKSTKTNIGDNTNNLNGPLNTDSLLAKHKWLQSSFNQETILFREASLRGCYNIETILKEVKSPLHIVGQEVNRVRESIYSAIRMQRRNDDIIIDSILSILEICKSWIKLNSHFEREEFKNILNVHGVDSSVLTDFLQWQCISRIFIDKMISALTKITSAHNTGCNSCNTFNSSCTTNFDRNEPQSNLINGNNSSGFNSREGQHFCTLPKCELVQNKHWKQRRFLSDQHKLGAIDFKTKRPCKSKLTISSTYDSPQFRAANTDVVFGQGDNGKISYNHNVYFGKANHSLPTSSNQIIHEDVNCFSNESNFTQQKSVAGTHDKKGSWGESVSAKCLREFSGIRGDTNAFPISSGSDVSCSSTPNVIDCQVNQGSIINPLPLPTIPPFYGNQLCVMNPGQVQASQWMLKSNPIHCIDTDASENCVRSSYMKPGSYNPPQKPVNCQKPVNNNLPIEDIPIVGIPFLYSDSQNHQFKTLNTPSSSGASENCSVKKSDDTWRTALSLAESFRDTLMASKAEDITNSKLSENVPFRTHFLLSDGASQHSSNSNFKLESESDELTAPENSTSALELSVVEAQLKTTDWLIKSFNKAVTENEKDRVENKNNLELASINKHIKEFTGVNGCSEEFALQEETKENNCISSVIQRSVQIDNAYNNDESILNKSTQETKSELVNHLHRNNGMSLPQKKTKKNKRIRDDYMASFDHKPSMLCRKPKSIFKKSITKQVTCKLEDILDCIWNTEVSNLLEEELKSEKEVSRLELKVRSPLYLQTMRSKLTNHNYDTLEHALTDFQQYFIDMRSRNKGDKQCIEAVGAMERIFLTLVEKHFGLMYQPVPQFFGHIGSHMAHTLKPRRPKKSSRRF